MKTAGIAGIGAAGILGAYLLTRPRVAAAATKAAKAAGGGSGSGGGSASKMDLGKTLKDLVNALTDALDAANAPTGVAPGYGGDLFAALSDGFGLGSDPFDLGPDPFGIGGLDLGSDPFGLGDVYDGLAATALRGPDLFGVGGLDLGSDPFGLGGLVNALDDSASGAYSSDPFDLGPDPLGIGGLDLGSDPLGIADYNPMDGIAGFDPLNPFPDLGPLPGEGGGMWDGTGDQGSDSVETTPDDWLV